MTFKALVIEYVNKIPSGKVTTYGAVASAIGQPRSARNVGYVLGGLTLAETNVPWWRVVNREGYLSINHGNLGIEKERQRDLLIEEGIDVTPDYYLDLKKYFWSE
ncbi:MAG: MGMT family protein [Candidatus Dojkabacteria bacterium]